jgi:hypothetical protein
LSQCLALFQKQIYKPFPWNFIVWLHGMVDFLKSQTALSKCSTSTKVIEPQVVSSYVQSITTQEFKIQKCLSGIYEFPNSSIWILGLVPRTFFGTQTHWSETGVFQTCWTPNLCTVSHLELLWKTKFEKPNSSVW